LAAQSSVSVSVVFQLNSPGIFAVTAVAGSSARETNIINNRVTLPLWARESDPSANAVLNLAVKDIARDPVRSRLYLAVGSTATLFPNSILALDFAAGTVVPFSMNGDPGRLAVSPDGNFLYVAQDASAAVRRLTLPELADNFRFSLSLPQPVTDMAVCRTNSDVVAIWRGTDPNYTV
jgi:DNA-binding beta-propeller fold protein YncE